jgi:NitT/TauT family transport system substrate-binding protein
MGRARLTRRFASLRRWLVAAPGALEAAVSCSSRWTSPRALAALGYLAALLLACSPGPSSAPKPAPEAPPPAAAAPAAAAPAAAPPPAVVRVGVLGSIGDAHLSIGIEKGYYAEQGLTIETTPFDSGARMIAPLSAGQLDVGQGAISAGVFNALARGVDIKAVAGASSSPPGHGNNGFVLRKEIAEQVRGPADLRGRKVGISALGITPEVELSELLARGGLSLADVELMQLNFGDQVTALGNGSIDLALISEPTATIAVDQDFGVIWLRSDEVIPNHLTSVVWYAPQFAAQTDVARRFMVAAIKAARLYNDAFFKNDPRAREEAIPIFMKHTPVKDRALFDRMVFQGIDPDGRVNRESLEHDQAYFVASGRRQSPLDVSRLVDASFAVYAVQQLGPYAR